MNVALRNTVQDATSLTRWAAKAMAGEPVTYHIGSMAADRAASPALHLLAETVMVLVEASYLAASQTVMRLPTGSATWYVATRTGRGRAPRSIMFDQCDAFTYRALQAVRERPADLSAAHAIRETLGCPDRLAADYLALLYARKWIEHAEPKGWQLSPQGQAMLM